MNYAYKFRLLPDKEQKIKLSKSFGTCRFIHNYFLDKRISDYLAHKKNNTYNMNCADLVELKKENLWMKEVNAQSLQQELINLQSAYDRFFKHISDFPQFHSKHDKQSFRIPQNIKIINNKIFFHKFSEGIKFKKHRQIEGTIRNITISKNKANQYFVCVLVHKEIKQLPNNNKAIGIDLGVKTLLCCSDGTMHPNIKPYRTLEKRLKKSHKALSRKEKGSKNREKARLNLAKLYNRTANLRSNHIHQITNDIINENQVNVIESLNASGMINILREGLRILDEENRRNYGVSLPSYDVRPFKDEGNCLGRKHLF